MPTLLLTDIVVRNAKPTPKKQVSIWDLTTKNFGLRINPKGTKTWQVMLGEKRQRITLGHYPDMSLKEARKLALKALAIGEAPPKRSTELTPYPASAAVAKYIEIRHANSRPRYAKDEQWVLSRHLLAKHADRPLDKFTAAHVVAITDELSDRPAMQFQVHRAIKSFFKWAVHRQLIPTSPAASLPKPGKVNERDRLLSDDELKRIYAAAVDLAYPYGFIVLICIHTGLRRGEVASLKWSYITDDFIAIPKEITKNHREHVIPNLIGGNLRLIPKGSTDYLFPTTAGTPFCAWGKNKARLDRLSGVTDFVLHDSRRYLSSTMRRLGVPIDVTETILNHVSGSRSQIQRIYDRHDRLPEMREALELYEKHLAALVAT